MGGAFRPFPTTVWSDVLAAADASDSENVDRVGSLLQTYWKPVYAYIRVAWGKSVEDAKDLTQAFFVLFLEKNYLARLHPDRGSFRGYLRKALKHFLINIREAEAVRRRSCPVVSLDAPRSEFERIGIACPGDTPEQAYDREWFRTLFEQSIEELGEHLRREGKRVYFEVFRSYCFEPSRTYGDVAGTLGIRDTDVRNHLTYCRKSLRRILRGRIRGYVSEEQDIEQELLEGMRA